MRSAENSRKNEWRTKSRMQRESWNKTLKRDGAMNRLRN